jgi:enoyl-CoA hydratase/carnithine racemase
MKADIFSAQKAFEYGLINEIFEPEDLVDRVMDTAKSIAKNGPIPLAQIKKGIAKALNSNLNEMFEYDSTSQAVCFESEDIKEGIKALREKRDPQFKGV